MFRDGFLSLVVDALLLAVASALGASIPCFLFGIPFADAMCTAAFGVAFSPIYNFRRMRRWTGTDDE